MSWSTLRWLVAGAGLVLVVLGLTADAIGLGGNPGFGWKQILATAAGVVLLVTGILGRPAAGR